MYILLYITTVNMYTYIVSFSCHLSPHSKLSGKVEVSHPHHPVMLRPGSGILKGIQPEERDFFVLGRKVVETW